MSKKTVKLKIRQLEKPIISAKIQQKANEIDRLLDLYEEFLKIKHEIEKGMTFEDAVAKHRAEDPEVLAAIFQFIKTLPREHQDEYRKLGWKI